MKELSLHIMDVVENGITAGASLITLSILEDRKKNRLQVTIIDNGKGVSNKDLEKILDPFFTSRTTRRVGLGLSLFREASLRCNGNFVIKSKEGKGTKVVASFERDHIDLAPIGDMAGTFIALIIGNSKVDFVYTFEKDGDTFQVDTRLIKKELEGVPITNPTVVKYISDIIKNH